MELTLVLLQQIIAMFIIIAVGMLCKKINLIRPDGYKDLSRLLLQVVNPLLVFTTFQQPFDPQRLRGLLMAIGISIAGMVTMVLLSIVFIPKKKNPLYRIERMAAAYPNCGYIGIPLVRGVFGDEGVFYLTGTILVFNLFFWTHGVILMRGGESSLSLKEVSRKLFNPMVFSCLAGFLCYVVGLRIPSEIGNGLQYIGNMNTPLAMLIAGGVLAQTNFKKVMVNVRVYYVAFLKLIVFPVLLIAVFLLVPSPSLVILSVMLALGGSTASGVTAMALMYDCDPLYASELFAMSTILTVVTLPMMMMVAQFMMPFYGRV